jgi:diguanylate cyclase (GGDEF)-like protein
VSTTLLIGSSLTAAATGILLGHTAARARIRYLRQLLDQAIDTAGRDHLTGLPNRAHAEELLNHRHRHRQPTTLALLDLDRFKTINDTHGHRAGDHVLTVIAGRLATAAARHGGVAARLGGDEFLLILPEADTAASDAASDSASDAVSAAQRTVTAPIPLPDRPGLVTLTASAGIAALATPDGGGTDDADHGGVFVNAVHHADIALHHAKQRPGSLHHHRPGAQLPTAGGHGAAGPGRPGAEPERDE